MRIGSDLLLQGFVTILRLPDLGPAVEEALVARRPVQNRRRLAVQRQVIGLKPHRHARGVADVLAHRQAGIDGVADDRLIGRILRTQTRGQGLEVGLVLRRPPVAQHAVAVGLGALVVEAVADLVADHPADAAIVDRRIAVRIEEGRLQDRRREDDLVVGRVVVGVHRLRGHAPLRLVDRLVQAGQIIVPLEQAPALGVADQVVRADVQAGIVAPLLGIADLDRELAQLLLRRRLGLRPHPRQGLDPVRQGGAQIGDQFFHLGLGFGREILSDVKPARGLAQRTFGEGDGALFAGALLGLARQIARAELPLGVREALGHHRRHVIGGVEGFPGLQQLDRRLGVDGRDLGHGRVLSHDQARHAAQFGGVVIGLPGEAGRVLGEFGDGELVVGLVAVAVLGRRPVGLGDLAFQGHDLGGGLGWVGPADHTQHARDIGLVQDLLVGETGVQIIVPVGQADARLTRRDDVAGRLFGIDGDAGAEEGRAEAADRLAHIDGHLVMAVGGADRGQIGLQRLGVQLLDARFVDVGAIGVGDLGLVRTGRQVGAVRQAQHQFLHTVVRQFAQQGERAIAGAVRRDDQFFQRLAVGVLEEVVARLNRCVAAGHVEAPGPVTGRLGALPARRRLFAREQRNDRAGLVDTGVVVADVLRKGGAGGQKKGADSSPDKQSFHHGFLEAAPETDGSGRTLDPREGVSP
ncbi:hypothetical protein BREVUG8_90154 [Brevundimonas sp. G8]|nr:hypothetical protein BREVUG8_90154 [Brevundimonas sp. G8]